MIRFAALALPLALFATPAHAGFADAIRTACKNPAYGTPIACACALNMLHDELGDRGFNVGLLNETVPDLTDAEADEIRAKVPKLVETANLSCGSTIPTTAH